MNNAPEELTGTIERFVFRSEENGFAIGILKTTHPKPITIAGNLPNVYEGERVTLKGAWVVHPKFGQQFKFQEFSTSAPTTSVGLKKYLASGLIKGIGPAYAEKLVDHFGTNVLTIIDQEPKRLKEVPGIGAGRLATIITAWQDQRDIATIMVFLQDKGISSAYATKIYKKYGTQSIAYLQENPYRLAEDIWGIGFKTADQIAQNMGIAPTSEKRVQAGLFFSLSSVVKNGHLYSELEELKNNTAQLLELERSTIDAHLTRALHNLYNADKIKLISENEQHYVSLTQFYSAEKSIAHSIKKLNKHASSCTINLDSAYQFLRTKQHEKDLVLNEEQQAGIMTCLHNKVSVITGGPGTGKTTLIKKLLAILDKDEITYRLAAPTGRAAKRITESTGKHASTIHRLLEFDFTTYRFKHNEQNALPLDFLIIDEASMIDVFLGSSLVKAVPHGAHIVFIGDIDQLPSVGAGNFLHDMIASQIIAVVRLKTIFRQALNSLIIVNAHRINTGEFPTSSAPGTQKNFIFIPEQDATALSDHLRAIFQKGLQRCGIDPHKAIVLTPMNRGSAGTQTINQLLQSILNANNLQTALPHTGRLFALHDRVMQIRNNYDKKVFNGDIGTITAVDMQEKTILVNYDYQEVTYQASELDELILSYAATIHKSQGSEFDAVIIPLFMQHFTLLQRNLLYTAVTRAKKLCILIGEKKAIGMAVKNNKNRKRVTFLQKFLTATTDSQL